MQQYFIKNLNIQVYLYLLPHHTVLTYVPTKLQTQFMQEKQIMCTFRK